jgi:hypothetical protein
MEDWCNITNSVTRRVSRNLPYGLFTTTHPNGIILELNSAFRGEDLLPKDLTMVRTGTYSTEHYNKVLPISLCLLPIPH